MKSIKIQITHALIIAAICQLITLGIVLNATSFGLGICGFISFIVAFFVFELIKKLHDKQRVD
jgi:hypothetical protein